MWESPAPATLWVVSHLCDLLLSAGSCPAVGLGGCTVGQGVAGPSRPVLREVRCLPGCIPCTCTVSVDVAELVLTQPCWRLGVCA